MATFRSNSMSKVEIIFKDIQLAEQFIDQMGNLGIIEFIDLQKNTSSLKKPHSRDLLQIKELLNTIKIIQQTMDKYKSIQSNQQSHESKQDDEGKYDNDTNDTNDATSSALKYDDISNTYESLKKLETNEESINMEVNKQNNITRALSSEMDLFMAKEKQKYGREYAGYFIGFVNNAQRVSLQRQIYLISKPDTIIQFKEDGKDQNFFIVFYNDDTMKSSLYRVCQLMNIEICYDSMEHNKEQLLWDSIRKSEELKQNHNEMINALQRKVLQNESKIKQWKDLLLRKKAIKTVLNMCIITTDRIKMNGWCSITTKEIIKEKFMQITMHQTNGGQIVFQDVSKYDANDPAPTSLGDDSDCVIL